MFCGVGLEQIKIKIISYVHGVDSQSRNRHALPSLLCRLSTTPPGGEDLSSASGGGRLL